LTAILPSEDTSYDPVSYILAERMICLAETKSLFAYPQISPDNREAFSNRSGHW